MGVINSTYLRQVKEIITVETKYIDNRVLDMVIR